MGSSRPPNGHWSLCRYRCHWRRIPWYIPFGLDDGWCWCRPDPRFCLEPIPMASSFIHQCRCWSNGPLASIHDYRITRHHASCYLHFARRRDHLCWKRMGKCSRHSIRFRTHFRMLVPSRILGWRYAANSGSLWRWSSTTSQEGSTGCSNPCPRSSTKALGLVQMRRDLFIL